MAKKEVERPYLTQDELDILANKEFAMPRIAQIRDVFCFVATLAYPMQMFLN